MEEKRKNELIEIEKIFSEDMGLCRCGVPEEAYELVRGILSLAPFYNDFESVVRLIGNDGAHHIVLSVIERAGLIEHGGGIGGAWMTPKGERFLALLETVKDWDELENAHEEVPQGAE